MTEPLHGSNAFVTGGGRGIGRAAALALARAGAGVAVCARTPEAVRAVAHEIEARGGRAIGLVADVDRIRERGWYGLRLIQGLDGPEPA